MRTPLSFLLAPVLGIVLLAGGAPTPAHADSLDEVRAKISVLEDRSSEVGEQYDAATEKLAEQKQRAATIAAEITAKEAKTGGLLEGITPMLLDNFQNRNVDPALVAFGSTNADEFLSRLSTADKVQQNLNDKMQEYELQLAGLADMKREQDYETAQSVATQAELAALKQQLADQSFEAEQLLMRLTAAEMAKLNGGKGVTYDPEKLDLKGSDKRMVKAVKYAVAQAGNKPYIWATAGPDSFDCSGLMLAAYAKGGISLPHFSGAQAKLGHEVKIKDLQPGDLIFFYSPIHHVGMYIGNGLFVHARNTRVGVVIQPLASYHAPITNLRRIVG